MSLEATSFRSCASTSYPSNLCTASLIPPFSSPTASPLPLGLGRALVGARELEEEPLGDGRGVDGEELRGLVGRVGEELRKARASGAEAGSATSGTKNGWIGGGKGMDLVRRDGGRRRTICCAGREC